jgi:hypothetical protein
VASKGRHTRSTPQLPLATPEADPEKITRKGKALQEGTSTAELGISDDSHYPLIETPISTSHSLVILSVGVSQSLNFGSVPVDLSPPGLGLEGESFVTPISPDVVAWSRPRTLEYFPTPGFTTPPPIKVVSFTARETSVPSSPLAFSPNTLMFSFPPINKTLFPPVRTPSPPSSPPPFIPMVGSNPARNKMDSIVAARYAPLVLPQPMNALHAGDYLKYMPKFTGEEDIIVEEHLDAFYSYVENLNIENEDVWMKVFVQSLDGEVRKWFRGLTPGSIAGIEALDDVFLRQLGG